MDGSGGGGESGAARGLWRGRVVNLRDARRHLRVVGEEPPAPAAEDADLPARPRTRGDCAGGPRPCPWASCRHHLLLDVLENGSIRYSFQHADPSLMAETCALDVADRGPATLEEIGDAGNVTRERIRQIEGKALKRLRAHARREGVEDALGFAHPEEESAPSYAISNQSAAGAEDDDAPEEPFESAHARAAFLPEEHRAVVDALHERRHALRPSAAPGDAELAHLAALALASPPQDDAGWTVRVWQAYLRSSEEHGHGPPPGLRYRADGRSYVYKPRTDAQKAGMFPRQALGGKTVNEIEEETKRAHDALEGRLGRAPTAAELAKEMGLTVGAATQRLGKLRRAGVLARPGHRSGRASTLAPPEPPAPAEPAPDAAPEEAQPAAAPRRRAPRRKAVAETLGGFVARVLRRERARLAARLAEVDRTLAELGVSP